MTGRHYAWVMALALSGCTAHMDMQGLNPQEYYAEHPIKNRVETQTISHAVEFVPGSDRLRKVDIDTLREAVKEISPEAVEHITVLLSKAQITNSTRREHVKAVLRGMGYASDTIVFDISEDVSGREARVEVVFVAVVPPHCPDWRTSPVTTYSNSSQGNFGCATTVNLGQMVADPRDLVRGSGSISSDAARGAEAIRAYKAGEDLSAGGGAADSATASTGSTGSSSQ